MKANSTVITVISGMSQREKLVPRFGRDNFISNMLFISDF